MRNYFFVGLCAILFAPAPSIAASPQQELAKLAVEGNGVIRLNPSTYDLLTSPKRTWSASVHFTAMDPRRRCHPCMFVALIFLPIVHFLMFFAGNSILHGLQLRKRGRRHRPTIGTNTSLLPWILMKDQLSSRR